MGILAGYVLFLVILESFRAAGGKDDKRWRDVGLGLIWFLLLRRTNEIFYLPLTSCALTPF